MINYIIMSNTNVTIKTDKFTYGKGEQVIVTAAYLLNNWKTLILQAYDGTGKKIAEKDFSKSYGPVTWNIPANVFVNSDPEYAAIILCEGEKGSVKFEHY